MSSIALWQVIRESNTSNINFWQVDAFTNEIFKGNPAVVIVMKHEMDDSLMQNIAIEMNQSETAFILLREGKKPLLRWFTPMYEIDLCGHATLASAHIMFSEVDPSLDVITFDTKFVGELTVEKNGDMLVMDFPSRPGDEVSVEDIPEYVLKALSDEKPVYARKSRDLMLVYEDEQTILEMKPNFVALLDYKDFIIATSKSSNPNYDFVSRFFCATDGILEDPVTGSAHSTLTPYWAKMLQRNRLSAFQASSRGGRLELELQGDRVSIAGNAVTIISGSMRLK